MTYYDDTFTKIARRNSYDASQIVRWAQGSGSAYYIKNYDPHYKYFIPNLLARLIEILLAGFIFFIICNNY